MAMTVLELGWGHYYAIPNEKVSKFLDLFDDMNEVDSVYIGDTECQWYYKQKPKKLNMHLIDRFVTEANAMEKQREYQEKHNGA